MDHPPNPSRGILVATFLLSGALLAYEVFVIRIISILYFEIAAYLVISLALLGYGVGSSILATRRSGRPLDRRLAAVGSLLFSIFGVVMLALVWAALPDRISTPIVLIAIAIPFVCGGFALATALSLPNISVNRIYFADLVGAGLGSILIFAGLLLFSGDQLALMIAAAGLIAAGLFHFSKRLAYLSVLAAAALLVLAVFIDLKPGIVSISQKELKRMVVRVDDESWEYQGWSPIARIDVFEISDACTEFPIKLECKLVTQDGSAPSILLRIPEDPDPQNPLRQTIFGLPYWMPGREKALIIGLGGGPDILAALLSEVSDIDGVEINPQMISIVRDEFSNFIGNPVSSPQVTVHYGDGRNFIRESGDHYDVIQLTGVDTSVASLGANPNLAENYLYTIEAFDMFYNHLTEDGVFSVSFPAIDGLGLRLLATATEALRQNGVQSPSDHLVVSEITGFIHVLMKRSAYSEEELDLLFTHFEEPVTSFYFPLYHRLFGEPSVELITGSRIIAAPGMERPSLYQSYFAAEAEGRAAEFLASQPRNVFPATDDLPFFFILDKWGQPSIIYETLILTLVVLAVCASLFIVGPLIIQNRRGLGLKGGPLLAAYFLLVGIAYILIEVNLIQKLTILLGHASIAIVLTISTLLVASGLGSWISGIRRRAPSTTTLRSIAIIAVLVLIEALLLSYGVRRMPALSFVWRIIFAIILIAIPGFFMGMPFPNALEVVKWDAPIFVPWAYAINGVGSVVATIMGVLLAINFGFNWVFVFAAGLYICAGLGFLVYWRRFGSPLITSSA